jgi:hypothetical protein
MADPLSLSGVDLAEVRDRLTQLDFFLSVTDIQAATQVIEGDLSFTPPAAFVSIPNETFEPNRYAAGGHGQRGIVTISVLYCIPSQRAADDVSDEVEQAKRAVRDILKAWTPKGAGKPLDLYRYAIRLNSDGLIWPEWLFRTSYDLVS